MCLFTVRAQVSIGRRTGRMLRRNMKSALGRSALGSGADECAACRGQRTRIAKFVQSQQSFMPAVSTPLTAPKLFGELANISRPLLYVPSPSSFFFFISFCLPRSPVGWSGIGGGGIFRVVCLDPVRHLPWRGLGGACSTPHG